MELRTLTPEWINASSSTLTSKSIQFLNQIDTMNKVVVKKTAKKSFTPQELMGENYQENIAIYRSIFPQGTLPSGIPSRISVVELEKKFITFFTLFTDYSWEMIHEATRRYVVKFSDVNYLHMRNTGYFISKQLKTGETVYDLATRCDMLDQTEPEGLVYDTVRSI